MRALKRMALSFLLALGAGAPAFAQTWPLCFEGETIPLPATYAAFREASHIVASTERFRARARISIKRDGPELDRLQRARLSQAYLEALRAGLSPSFLEAGPVSDLEVEPGCLLLEVTVTPPPEIPPAPRLWHLQGAYFDSGSTMPGEAGLYWIDIAAALNYPGAIYVLNGHTDTLGTVDANLDLSRRRAIVVAEQLVRRGVRWEDIEINYHGETQLARPSPGEASEPLNRRVWTDMRFRPATSD